MSAIAATRMFHVLREQRSFMYSGAAAVAWMPAQRPSPFYSAAAVSVAKVDSALVDWLALLRGLRAENPATAREVAAARRNIVGVLPARIDGPEAVAARVAELVRDGLPTDYLTSYAAGLSAVTPSDVTAAASKYIDPDHLTIVVVGDRKVIEPSLRAANLAPMVIVE
jgi:zinc protease